MPRKNSSPPSRGCKKLFGPPPMWDLAPPDVNYGTSLMISLMNCRKLAMFSRVVHVSISIWLEPYICVNIIELTCWQSWWGLDGWALAILQVMDYIFKSLMYAMEISIPLMGSPIIYNQDFFITPQGTWHFITRDKHFPQKGSKTPCFRGFQPFMCFKKIHIWSYCWLLRGLSNLQGP